MTGSGIDQAARADPNGPGIGHLAFWARPGGQRADEFTRLRTLPGLQLVPFGRPVPFRRAQAGIYAVVRHADVVEASRTPTLFSSEPAANMVIDMPPWLAPYFDSVINMDDPRHSTIRKMVARAFSPKLLAKLEDDLQARARRIVDDVISAAVATSSRVSTTPSSGRTVLAHALRLFTEHPDQRALLLADFDAAIAGAIEEIVRYASPVVLFRRTVTRDCRLGGQPLRAGDKLLLFYNSANRDETVFADPDRFDITRSPNPHVDFGGPGPHYCLGANLARREITVMLRELFTRLPEIRTVGEPEPLLSYFLNGIKRWPFVGRPVWVRLQPGHRGGPTVAAVRRGDEWTSEA